MNAQEQIKAIEKTVREFYTPAMIDEVAQRAMDRCVQDLEKIVGQRVRQEVVRVLGENPASVIAEAQVWATLTLAAVGMEDYSLAQSYRTHTTDLLERHGS